MEPAMSRNVTTIPFDEIVQGATVRVAVVDNVQYLSIRDIIMWVCGKDSNQAGAVWRNLSSDVKQEVQQFLLNFRFPGQGQTEQPVITFVGALKLIMFLPGEAAKKHRSAMANILRRYCAADKKEMPSTQVEAAPVLLSHLEKSMARNVTTVSTIPFDDIVQGATVRVAVIDGVQYLSIRDVIMCVCNKDGDHAGQTWRNLNPDKKMEVRDFLANLKFPGPGQTEQPVITFVGALKLIMFLPGEAAKKHRSAMANILRRYYAGDASLIEDLARNAQSESPVSQLARASLAAEPAPETRIEDSRKRKREELELLKLETEIKALDRNSQVALYQSQMAMVETYRSLCGDMDMDERAKVMLKDAILNSATMGRAITNGSTSDEAKPISVSQVASALGHHFDTKQLCQVGRIASKLYTEQHGVPPSKHSQLVEGRATEVNTYFEPDRPLLEQACAAYANHESQKRRAAAIAAEEETPTLDRWLRRQAA